MPWALANLQSATRAHDAALRVIRRNDDLAIRIREHDRARRVRRESPVPSRLAIPEEPRIRHHAAAAEQLDRSIHRLLIAGDGAQPLERQSRRPPETLHD